MRKLYVLAIVDVSGPIPIVVNVNTYSSECICLFGGTRTWKLLEIEMPRFSDDWREQEKAEKEFVCQKLREEGEAWAIPAFLGEIKLPHRGR